MDAVPCAWGVLCSLFLMIPTGLHAQKELPAIVRRGIEAIGSGRADSAFMLWSNSVAFGPEERSQVISSIPMFNQMCTLPQGYDLLRSIVVSPHIERVYFAVRCESRPVFFMLAVYQSATDWLVTAVTWNTDPDRILPAAFYGAQRP